MDVSMMELSKRRTLEGKNREEGNGKPPRLFSLDMIPGHILSVESNQNV